MIGLHSRNATKALLHRALSTTCSQQWLESEREVAENLLTATFSGLRLQHAYNLGFYGNVATSDPLARCHTYLGTDQRDDIAGFLADEFSLLPQGARIADIGAGDGQTFELGEAI